VFCEELSAAGVICASIGLEAPYQLGKVERKGGVWKDIAHKVIEAKQIEGIAKIRLVIHEVNAVVNEMSRAGGFSPAQWATGRLPRYAAGERGDDEQVEQLIGMEERVGPNTVFG
jgi:hypothetical protein